MVASDLVEQSLENLPAGWMISEHNKRKVYLTPLPRRVKIDCKAKLKEYQEKGKYLEMKVENLIFGVKRKRKAVDPTSSTKLLMKPADESTPPVDGVRIEETSTNAGENEQIVESSRMRKLRREQSDLTDAVRKLTRDPNKPICHKALLGEAAKKLNDLRLKSHTQDLCPDIGKLKTSLQTCNNEEDIAKVVWSSSSIQQRLSNLHTSKLLEQILSLGLMKGNPLSSFPPDQNRNLYQDVIEFALLHAEDVLSTLLTLTVKHESPVEGKDVVQLAYLFATLAEFVSAENNVMKKTKSLSLKSSGLTNQGLDSQNAVGATVSSRTFRNDRDMCAGFSEEIAKEHAKKGMPQFTFDNMDLQINHTMHHFALNFSEFENLDTSHLPTICPARSDMVKLFTLDAVLLAKDVKLLKHYEFLTALSVGRLMGE